MKVACVLKFELKRDHKKVISPSTFLFSLLFNFSQTLRIILQKQRATFLLNAHFYSTKLKENNQLAYGPND